MREGENEGKGKFREELRETNVQAWDVVSSHHSHVTLAFQPSQPSLVFTLAVTMFHGFLVPSQIYISPRRKRRWLTVALRFAVHSPQETPGLLTYPPDPLIFTQPLSRCHPQ